MRPSSPSSARAIAAPSQRNVWQSRSFSSFSSSAAKVHGVPDNVPESVRESERLLPRRAFTGKPVPPFNVTFVAVPERTIDVL